MKPIHKTLTLTAIGAVALIATQAGPALADQQKWSSQYVHWSFDDAVEEVWNIDQQVWIPVPNTAGYWPVQWGWNDLSDGGYMGLQQGHGSQNVRFSIWNATEASGSDCRTFGGEGIGYTCELPVQIDAGKFYRLRLWRTEAADDGQWWGAWLIEENAPGELVEHHIGQIKAPVAAKTIDPQSISNFAEYFGPAVPACEDVPLSIVGFTPPAVNYHGAGTGAYGGYSSFSHSDKADGNQCEDGTEGQGAFITAKTYDFGFAEGAMVFMGGQTSDHDLDDAKHPTPGDMPDS